MSRKVTRPVFMWISLVIMAFSGVMGIDRVPDGRNYPVGLLKTTSDPIYASSAISINPYPTLAGEPIIVAVVLQNPTNNEIAISVAFSYAEFGIGLPFYPIDGVINLVIPPHGIAQPAVVWIPPHGGLWCLQVVVAMPDQQEIIAQRNIDVIEPLLPGVTHELTFPVGNPLDHTVNITMASVAHLSGWGIELNPAVLLNMQAGEVRQVTLSVTPPQGTPLPPDGTIIVDVEAYAGQQLIGGFRKIFRPPVPLHVFPDPAYAEREISISPYPVRLGEPTQVCVELRNPTSTARDVAVNFAWANFGIGLPFTPIDGPQPVHLPPFSIVNTCMVWVPPVSGHFCLQVRLEMDGYLPQVSQRNLDVMEPLLPGVTHELIFPVGNPLDHAVDITMASVPHVSGWGIGLNPAVLLNMQAGEVRQVTLSVTPPQGTPLPPDGTIIVDVEAYAGQQLIGGFRKIFRPPVPLHVFPDPLYAEREISISPYPVRLGEPTQICVELRNPTSTARDVAVNFAWANFGIGLPFAPIDGPQPVHLPPFSIVNTCMVWVPPVSGHFCLQVRLDMDGYLPQVSQRNLDVMEPLLPGVTHELIFPVGNPLDHAVDISLASVAHLSGWGIGLNPAVLPNMQAGEVRLVTLSVTPPQGTPLPPDGTIIVDVEAYAGQQLIGGFRKFFSSPAAMLYFPIIVRPD